MIPVAFVMSLLAWAPDALALDRKVAASCVRDAIANSNGSNAVLETMFGARPGQTGRIQVANIRFGECQKIGAGRTECLVEHDISLTGGNPLLSLFPQGRQLTTWEFMSGPSEFYCQRVYDDY